MNQHRLKLIPLPPTADQELREAYEAAVEASTAARKCERALTKARKLERQRIIRYDNLVLEHLGQMRLELE